MSQEQATPPSSSPAFELGKGYDGATDTPKTLTCLGPFEKRVRLKDDQYMSAFTLYRREQTSQKVKESLKAKFGYKQLSIDLGGQLNELYGVGSVEKEILVLLVHAETVERYVSQTNSDPNDWSSACDPTDESIGFESLSQFVDTCGDRFASAEVTGGVIMLSADISQISKEAREELGSKLQVDLSGKILFFNVASTLDSLTTSQSELNQIRFKVGGKGFPKPSPSLLNNDELSPDRWVDYMNELRTAYVTAYDAGEYDSSAYGVVLDQQFELYGYDDLSNCSIGGAGLEQLFNEFRCYQNFQTEDDSLYGSQTSFKLNALRADAERKLALRDSIQWANPPEVTIAAFEEAVATFWECAGQKREQSRTACTDARNNGEVMNLCTACAFEPQCSASGLVGVFESLPTSYERPPERNDNLRSDELTHYEPVSVTQNITQAIGYSNDRICVLTYLNGNMADLGERTELRIDGANR